MKRINFKEHNEILLNTVKEEKLDPFLEFNKSDLSNEIDPGAFYRDAILPDMNSIFIVGKQKAMVIEEISDFIPYEINWYLYMRRLLLCHLIPILYDKPIFKRLLNDRVEGVETQYNKYLNSFKKNHNPEDFNLDYVKEISSSLDERTKSTENHNQWAKDVIEHTYNPEMENMSEDDFVLLLNSAEDLLTSDQIINLLTGFNEVPNFMFIIYSSVTIKIFKNLSPLLALKFINFVHISDKNYIQFLSKLQTKTAIRSALKRSWVK